MSVSVSVSINLIESNFCVNCATPYRHIDVSSSHKTLFSGNWQFIFIQFVYTKIPKTSRNYASLWLERNSCILCLSHLFVLSLTQITFTVCLLSIELENDLNCWYIVCLIFFPSLLNCLFLYFFFKHDNVFYIYLSSHRHRISTRQFINQESNFRIISHAPFNCLAYRITFLDCHSQNLMP